MGGKGPALCEPSRRCESRAEGESVWRCGPHATRLCTHAPGHQRTSTRPWADDAVQDGAYLRVRTHAPPRPSGWYGARARVPALGCGGELSAEAPWLRGLCARRSRQLGPDVSLRPSVESVLVVHQGCHGAAGRLPPLARRHRARDLAAALPSIGRVRPSSAGIVLTACARVSLPVYLFRGCPVHCLCLFSAFSLPRSSGSGSANAAAASPRAGPPTGPRLGFAARCGPKAQPRAARVVRGRRQARCGRLLCGRSDRAVDVEPRPVGNGRRLGQRHLARRGSSALPFACMAVAYVASISAWIAMVGAAPPAVEREALLDLYHATDGPNWRCCHEWATSAANVSVCTWKPFVGCDATETHVTSLILGAKGLAGT